MWIILETAKEEQLFRVPEISIDDLKTVIDEFNLDRNLKIMVDTSLFN